MVIRGFASGFTLVLPIIVSVIWVHGDNGQVRRVIINRVKVVHVSGRGSSATFFNGEVWIIMDNVVENIYL